MAFVVPAELGHANYAAPLLGFFARNFASTHVIAIRTKLFPVLSEDCWLLYAEGFSGSSNEIGFSALDSFTYCASAPKPRQLIALSELKQWNYRLRPFLVSKGVRDIFADAATNQALVRLGDLAKVNIGYVTGANSFFHLRPSQARRLRIPADFLLPSVRKSSALRHGVIDQNTVDRWLADDDQVLLLKIDPRQPIPESVKSYLQSEHAEEAKASFKCRTRMPWYAVPDVVVPDAFITNMSGTYPAIVENGAGCVGSNSVLTVQAKQSNLIEKVCRSWGDPLTQVSCELEGHPLGGGMLKLEPREACRIAFLDDGRHLGVNKAELEAALATLRVWRHNGKATGTTV